jgi:hypothetical protein
MGSACSTNESGKEECIQGFVGKPKGKRFENQRKYKMTGRRG